MLGRWTTVSARTLLAAAPPADPIAVGPRFTG